MQKHVINLLEDALSESNMKLDNCIITLLGISYKPNVHDIQIAPSEQIIKLLNEKNAKLKIFDPYFNSENVFGYKIEKSIQHALVDSDAVIIITGHKEFEELDLQLIATSMNKPIVIDCTGKINPKSAKSNGIIFRGIGRGEK